MPDWNQQIIPRERFIDALNQDLARVAGHQRSGYSLPGAQKIDEHDHRSALATALGIGSPNKGIAEQPAHRPPSVETNGTFSATSSAFFVC
jgi:hypothetical protein